jgi:Kdo2-lipid IVA lauroyltransferase/acyltransferase
VGRERSALRNRVEYAAFLTARWASRALPPRALAGLGAAIGASYLRLGRGRTEILRHNLALAFPELDETARERLGLEVARHFGRVTLDALRLQRATPDSLLHETTVLGREHLESARADGRGVFLLSAHIGSWEVAALVAGLLIPGGFSVINRPLDNPLLDVELARLRSSFGNRALGKKRISLEIMRELKAGRVVGILIDQRALPGAAVEVPFFGHAAATHAVLGRLVERTGAPVVPLWAFWEAPARYTVRFDPPLRRDELPPEDRDALGLTRRFLAVTEAVIRERPEQWLWFHDRWRQRPGRSLSGSRVKSEE